jgi:hypothetical protein
MAPRTTVTVVEIDVPTCSLTYGVAPCTAAIPDTGTRKCFNTRATCQDRPNFAESFTTFRFFRPSAEPEIFDGLAVLRDVDVTPQQLDPGNTIGQRESVRVLLDDFQHSDAGFDKYLDDRGYDPYPRGSFWGRFRARVPSLRGAALRVMRGDSGQPLAGFDVWHYVIDTTAGPADGSFSITAKDALKLADGDRAQAPRPSKGQLSADLAAGAGSCTLTPAGIGNAEYPSSGKVAIGGNEIASFTRVGDVLTLTDRGMHNTEDADHDSGERVQVVLEYTGMRPDELLVDLFSYTDIDPGWIDAAAWQAEIEAYTPRLYGAILAEPTPVKDLINELVEQIALVLWMDTRNQQLRLRGLREVGADAALIDSDRFLAGTFSSNEQPAKRVSQSWCYYGLKNPLENPEDPKNFACIAIGVDDTGADEEYGGEAIRTTYSRWISAFNRQAAERLNEVLLARLRNPPRRIGLSLYVTDSPPQLGAGAFVKHHDLQDVVGDEVQVPVQVIELEAADDRFNLIGEEQQPVAADIVTEEKTVYIDADGYNLNLREIFDSVYTEPSPYDIVTFIVGGSVKIGTQAGGNRFAISSGDWPELIEPPTLYVQGRVLGRGGNGQNNWGYQNPPAAPGAGEHAIHVTSLLKIRNQGIIGGGGGGGCAHLFVFKGAGGGGQGFENSLGGASTDNHSGGVPNPAKAGAPGTPDAPGAGGMSGSSQGGNGGALGQPGTYGATTTGTPGAPYIPGAAGIAVHGDDLVTWLETGTIYGDQLDSTDPIP